MAKKNEQAACPRADIGGQAVLDGVMMKSPDAVAVAVRRPNGDIVVKREEYVSPAKKHKWMGWPFIRGSVSMVQMLGLGMRVLEDSMKMSGQEEEEPSKFEKWLAKKLGKNVDKVVMGLAIVMAVVLSVGLFIFLPNLLVDLIPEPEGSLSMRLVKNLVSGVIRTVILIGYITLVGRIPDMKKTFQYHGSEHKTVYCHEHDLPLTPKNAQQFTTLHPRYGTSFLLITFILSILFYSVIDVLIQLATGFNMHAPGSLPWRLLRSIVLLPVLAGISYELLKGLAHAENPLTRALRWPGLQLQRLTTRQPSDDQCEVAIASMNAALHGLPEGEKTEEGWVILHTESEDRPEEP